MPSEVKLTMMFFNLGGMPSCGSNRTGGVEMMCLDRNNFTEVHDQESIWHNNEQACAANRRYSMRRRKCKQ